MKRFIVTDDKKTVGKVLKIIEVTDRKDDKLSLRKLKFSINGYKKLSEKFFFQPFQRSTRLFFYLICSFSKNEKITNFVNVWMLEDRIQMETTITCGPFQLYF